MPQNLQIKVVDGPVCPKCGGLEVLQGGPVRPFKVFVTEERGWESHCTACNVWFDEDGNL